MAALQQQYDELTQKIRLAHNNAEDAFNRAEQFERIINRLDSKRTEARLKEESIVDAKSDLQEMEGSDEDLEGMLHQYDERASLYQSDLLLKTEDYERITAEHAEQQNELGKKQRDHGKYQAERDQFDRHIEGRKTLVKDTAARYGIRGFDYDLGDDKIEDFMRRMERLSREQTAVLDRARREANAELSDAQIALSHLNEEKSALNQSKENVKLQSATNEKKLETHSARINAFQIDEGAHSRLESSISEIRQNLVASKAKMEAADWDKQIRTTESHIRALDQAKDDLDLEIVQATKNAKETAQIDHLRKTLKAAEDSLYNLKGTHSDELSKILGATWDSSPEHAYENASKQRTSNLRDAESLQNAVLRQLDQTDFKIKTAKDELTKKADEAHKAEAEVRDVLGEEDIHEYHQLVVETENTRDTLKNDSQIAKYFETCRAFYVKHRSCRMCERPFHDDGEAERLQKKFTSILDKNSQKVAEELAQAEEQLKLLRDIAPSYETWQRLSDTEIPALERDIERLGANRADTVNMLEQKHDPSVMECKEAKYEVDKVNKSVQSIVKYAKDVENLKAQIEECLRRPTQSGISRSLDEINEEQRQVNEKSKAARKNLSFLLNERDHARALINNLEIEVRDANEKLKDTTAQIKEKDNAEGLMEELIAAGRELRESSRKIDTQIADLLPKIAQAQARLDEISRRADERERQLSAEASATKDGLNQLRAAHSEIDAFVDRKGPQQLAKADSAIKKIQGDLERIEVNQRQLIVEINKLRKEEASHSETKKSIERNLKYRSNKRALEILHSEIKELESQNAEADRDVLRREATNWQLERNKLTGQQSNLTGQMTTKDSQLDELVQEFKTDLKDAREKYREAMLKVVTTKAVIDDLGKYATALDKAIMQYHSLKMEEINGLIDELWRNTYVGSDVDTILIRSDNENARGNKTYNYRVCMVKQDVEMDMRGRCSAGQRVLACIIIRLALAECFGVSCGLIALDEPTTNLDRDNIIALARSLHNIIKTRKAQANFQLIIITHDEDFLREMRPSEFGEFYFRVSRDDDQTSKIDRQLIGDLDR